MASRFQFSLSSLFILLTLFGFVCVLGQWIGPVVVGTCLPLPLIMACEYVVCRSKLDHDPPPRSFQWAELLIVLGCALSTWWAAHYGTIAGMPEILSPIPLLTIIPFFVVTSLEVAFDWESYEWWAINSVKLIPAIWFLILNSDILNGRHAAKLPLRFVMTLGVATIASAYYLIAGWRYAIQYHGQTYATWVTGINVAFLLILWPLWFLALRQGTFGTRMIFATALHFWLFWFAFPWMGELI